MRRKNLFQFKMTDSPFLHQDYLINLINQSDLGTIGTICASHPHFRHLCINDPQIRKIILNKYETARTYKHFTGRDYGPRSPDRYGNLRRREPGLFDGPNYIRIRTEYPNVFSIPNIIDDQDELDAWRSTTPPGQVLEYPTRNGNFLFNCPDPQYPFPYFRKNKTSNSDGYPCLPSCGKIDSISRGMEYRLCDPRTPTTPSSYVTYPKIPPVYQRFVGNTHSSSK